MAVRLYTIDDYASSISMEIVIHAGFQRFKASPLEESNVIIVPTHKTAKSKYIFRRFNTTVVGLNRTVLIVFRAYRLFVRTLSILFQTNVAGLLLSSNEHTDKTLSHSQIY